MKESIYDIFIIGAGPIGMNCGIEAKKAGLSYKIIEKGCLVNSLFNYPYNMHFFSTSEKLEIGNIPFMSLANKPTRSEALEYYRRVAMHYNLDINLYEKVEKVENSNEYFKIDTDKGNYKGLNIVVATGFYDLPYLLNVPGEDLPKVMHYFTEGHQYYKQKVAVIGAANSAIDVALETYKKGADVTLLIKEDAISERVKYWVKPDIENRIKDGDIKAYFDTEVIKITPSHIHIRTKTGDIKMDNDFVFAMTGYKPSFSFLKNMGIVFVSEDYNKPVYDENTQESNVKNIFLAGVVCGGLQTNKWFIENSRVHADIITQTIKERKGSK